MYVLVLLEIESHQVHQPFSLGPSESTPAVGDMQVEHLWTRADVAEWEDLVVTLCIDHFKPNLSTARAGPFEVMAGEVASCPICGIEWTFDDQTDASKCVSGS